MSASPPDSPSSTLPTPQTSVSGSDSASSLMSTTSATSSPSSNTRHVRTATHPGAPSLPRRQSVSYNHMRASSLVTSSPFKDPNSKPIGAKYRPTPAPRPSPQHANPNSPRRPVSRERKSSKTSENKNQDNLKKPRKGQGLQALGKSEVVTRSPFLDGNRLPKTTAEPDADDAYEPLKLSNKSLQISTEVDPSPRQLPPTPTTPPRLSRHSGVPSTTNAPSPRSNLVSKRFHGPRSPVASPKSEFGSTKRRRRKTVTFDERCDVLEFDQEEPSEELLSDEEDEDPNDDADPSWDEYPQESPVMSDTVESVVESLLAEEVCGPGTVHTTFDYEPPEDHVNQGEHIQEPDAPEVEEEYVPIRHEPRLFVGEAVFSTPSPQRLRSWQNSPHRESSPSGRPHIIKDELRRQMEGQKQGLCNSEPSEDTPTYERASIPRTQPLLTDIREQSAPSVLEDSRTSTTEPEKPAIIEDALPTSGFKHMTTPQAVDLDDCRSALDKLMVGVQRGFDISCYSVDGRHEDDYETQSADGILDRGSPEDHIVALPPSASPIRRGSATTEPEMEEEPFTPPLDVLPPIPSIADSKPLPIDSPARHSTMRELPALPLPEPEWPLLEADSPIIRTRSPSPNAALGRRNTIKMHAEKIKLRRRQLRAERGDSNSRRRVSTSDAKVLIAEHALDFNGGCLLPVTVEDQPALGDELELEIAKRFPNVKRSYHLREQPDIIYASDDRVSHLGGVGDLELGLAWRTVRRPSDMFSYTKEIREARTRAQSGKAHGKVFVKVSGLRDIHIPLPSQPTFFTCVLNNGIHFVETPVVQLARDCLIEQEFELIEHEKLEFTLTIKIRKDPHISAILNPPPPLPAVRAATPSKSSVMRSLFSSPKHKKQASSKEAARSEPAVDPFARYMRKDLTVGRAFISFKDVLHRCDTKLFETSYPLIGQIHDERLIGTSGKATMTTPIGEIVLQVFRLPPIPGISADELPQSLEDCHRGLRHVQWHKKIWHEGGLTQYGGDCMTWRRRHFRVVGASLVAYNDITKKPTAKIDLRKAMQVEDETMSLPSSSGGETKTPRVLRRRSSFNALSGIEHSFRLVFPDEEICFYADTAEEKKRWLEVFGALIGKVPPKPLWAEMLWQQQGGEEATLRE